MGNHALLMLREIYRNANRQTKGERAASGNIPQLAGLHDRVPDQLQSGRKKKQIARLVEDLFRYPLV